MTADIATLGIAIDSSSVTQAKAALDQLVPSGAAAKKGAEDATSAFSMMNKQVQSLLSPFQSLRTTILAVTGAFTGLKLTEMAVEAAQLAARIQTLDVVMKAVGNSSGVTNSQMQAAAQGVRSMGITMQESASTVTRLAQANLDLSKASALARVAQDAAVIGNVNSSEALSRLIHGIQSAQPEILRTIGIQTSFEASYSTMAATLGKSASALSESEKAQARLNAVLQAGQNIAGTYEAAMGTASKMLSSTSRLIEDSTANAGKAFLPAYTEAVRGYYDALKLVNDQLDKMAKNGSLDAIGQGIKEIASLAADAGAIVAIGFAGRMVSSLTASISMWAQTRAAIKDGTAVAFQGAAGDAARAAAAAQAAEAAHADALAEREAAAAKVYNLQVTAALVEAEITADAARIKEQISQQGINNLQREIIVNRQALIGVTAELTEAEAALAVAQTRTAATGAASAKASAAAVAATEAATLGGRAMAALSAGLESLLALVGGPVGAAFLAVGAAIYMVANYETTADKIARQHSDTIREQKAEWDKLNGAINDNTKAQRDNLAVLDAKRKLPQVQADQQTIQDLINQGPQLRNTSSPNTLGRQFVSQNLYSKDVQDEVNAITQAVRSGTIDLREYAQEMAKVGVDHPEFAKVADDYAKQALTLASLNKEVQGLLATIGLSSTAQEKEAVAVGIANKAITGLNGSFQSLIQSSGMTVQNGQLISSGAAQIASAQSALADVNKMLAGTWEENGIKANFSADQLASLGEKAKTLQQILKRLQDSADPVGAALKKTGDAISLAQAPTEADRGRIAAIQDARRANGDLPLTADQEGAVASTADALALANLQQQNKQLQQNADLQKLVARAAAGTVEQQQQAARVQQVYNEALKTYGQEVANDVLAGRTLPADLQEMSAALKATDLAKNAGDMAKYSSELRLAQDAARRLADAAGQGEAAQRAAAAANDIAAASHESAAKGARAAAEATTAETNAILKYRNETVRGLQDSTAANTAMAKAILDGQGAIDAATRAQFELNAQRQIATDTTKNLAQQQQALNDLMAAYDANIASQKDVEASKRIAALQDQLNALNASKNIGKIDGATAADVAMAQKQIELKKLGVDLTTQEAQKEVELAGQIAAVTDEQQRKAAAQQALQQTLIDGAEQLGKSLVTSVVSGQDAFKAFGNVALNVLETILQKMMELAVINPILNSVFGGSNPLPTASGAGGLFGALTNGVGTWLGGLFGGGADIAATSATTVAPFTMADGAGWMAGIGFASGGYTGTGGKHDVAGVVHKGEYVFDQDTTKQFFGAMQDFKQNGMPTAPAMPVIVQAPPAANSNAVNVTVHNYGANNSDASVNTTTNADGSRDIDVILNQKIDSRMQQNITSGRTDPAMAQAYGARRIPVRRS